MIEKKSKINVTKNGWNWNLKVDFAFFAKVEFLATIKKEEAILILYSILHYDRKSSGTTFSV